MSVESRLKSPAGVIGFFVLAAMGVTGYVTLHNRSSKPQPHPTAVTQTAPASTAPKAPSLPSKSPEERRVDRAADAWDTARDAYITADQNVLEDIKADGDNKPNPEDERRDRQKLATARKILTQVTGETLTVLAPWCKDETHADNAHCAPHTYDLEDATGKPVTLGTVSFANKDLTQEAVDLAAAAKAANLRAATAERALQTERSARRPADPSKPLAKEDLKK